MRVHLQNLTMSCRLRTLFATRQENADITLVKTCHRKKQALAVRPINLTDTACQSSDVNCPSLLVTNSLSNRSFEITGLRHFFTRVEECGCDNEPLPHAMTSSLEKKGTSYRLWFVCISCLDGAYSIDDGKKKGAFGREQPFYLLVENATYPL